MTKLLVESAKVCPVGADSARDNTQDALAARSREDEHDERRRRDALACTISLWLGTMSLDELRHVDLEVMAVLRDRDGLGWARHDGEHEFHAITEHASGSVMNLCLVSWSMLDRYEIEARPARADRCQTCQHLFEERKLAELAAQHPIERGLAELRDATPTTQHPRVDR